MDLVTGFLGKLKINNNREWFHAHKADYEKSRGQFEAFLNALIAEIRKFDPSIGMLTPKDCIFRINRDIRFSSDKSPYKTNMGAYISQGGRKGEMAGYYLHIDPEQSFAAGGLYMPQAEPLKKIRDEIYFNAGEFKSIIHKPSFVKVFGEPDGDKLTRPPKGYPADFPDIDLLKYKSFTVSHALVEETIRSVRLLEIVTAVFSEMHPFIGFVNNALK
ncbi:MAG: DUF2461 domain-containing protein [Bacteroidales bacterium]